ncbi:hypothetical protein GCK72_003843 [Caenorhabditis remanei]|uniref:THAP-type domain-containing protein n=1 Tax=Caenorhabditis remanei TaxID=31234 RepID=A0A6A5H9J8_CAERE|nr:hypothetical protein GCK72_003843 [Caenorhabditis remanei]KAF1763897.1 hypothetical protein GCK72_003843 [Caenorhabditis remanei]
MSSQSRVIRRNCAFCAKAENRKQMIPVTKNKEQLLVWNQRLGAEFQENCEKTITPYLCLSHFPRKKAEFPRSKISPYLNGKPPNLARDGYYATSTDSSISLSSSLSSKSLDSSSDFDVESDNESENDICSEDDV